MFQGYMKKKKVFNFERNNWNVQAKKLASKFELILLRLSGATIDSNLVWNINQLTMRNAYFLPHSMQKKNILEIVLVP